MRIGVFRIANDTMSIKIRRKTMRKILLLSVFLFALSIILPSISSAANLQWPTKPTNLDSFQLSKNVTITYQIAAETYALISSHKQGDNLYGGAAGDSSVYVYRGGKTKGQDYTTDPTASDSSAFPLSQWSRL